MPAKRHRRTDTQRLCLRREVFALGPIAEDDQRGFWPPPQHLREHRENVVHGLFRDKPAGRNDSLWDFLASSVGEQADINPAIDHTKTRSGHPELGDTAQVVFAVGPDDVG